MDDDWVDVSDAPTIADLRWLQTHTNGDEPTADGDTWQPISLADLPNKPPLEPTLGGLGLIYPGKRHVLSGPQESAKTLAAYIIAIQVIRYHGPIILIDFEMGRYDARNRLTELGCTSTELQHVHYIEPAEPATTTHIGRLLALEPKLVIIDAAAGAYDLQGLDDNKRQDVERFTGIYVRGFWLAEIATIVLDHVVKRTDDRGKYAIGSERKVGGADVHLGFETITPIKRGSSGLYKITTHKDRGGFLKRGHLADLHLESGDEHQLTWELKPADETTDQEGAFRPTHLMEKVSRYLAGQTEPCSYSEIVSNTPGKDAYVRVAIDRLVIENYATTESGPRGAKLVSHERSFVESHDPGPPQPHPSPPGSHDPSPVPVTLQGTGRGGLGLADVTPARPNGPTDDLEFPF